MMTKLSCMHQWSMAMLCCWALATESVVAAATNATLASAAGTTATSSSSSTATPDIGFWSVHNASQADCIRLNTSLALLISYKYTNGTFSEPVTVDVPTSATVNSEGSSCVTQEAGNNAANVQSIQLDFYDTWSLTLWFTNSTDLDATKSTRFALYRVAVSGNYTELPDLFPNANDELFNASLYDTASYRRNYSAPITDDSSTTGKYLQCESAMTAQVAAGKVWLQTQHTHMMMAFDDDAFSALPPLIAKVCAYDTPRATQDEWLRIGNAAQIVLMLLLIAVYSVWLCVKGPVRVNFDESQTHRWQVPTTNGGFDASSSTLGDSRGTLTSVSYRPAAAIIAQQQAHT